MYYEAHGEGRPLVLISGLGNDVRAWSRLLPALARRYRVIVFDNRGSGRTAAPDGPFTIRMMADDAAGLLDALGIDRAHVVGVSMGGYIAQELALTGPSRVSGLVLATTSAGPYPLKGSILEEWVRGALSGMPPETFFQIMLPFMFNDRCFEQPGVLDLTVATIAPQAAAPPHVLARQITACVEFDARDRIGLVTAPTLVIAGREDYFVPFSLSEELAARIPGARLRILDGGGHGFTASTADSFNRAVLEFLDAVP